MNLNRFFFAAGLVCLGLSLQGCGREGEDLLSRTLEPQAAEALAAAGAALDRGDYRAALAYADSAERYEPGLAHADYLRGSVYMQTSQIARADSVFEALLKKEPYYRRVWLTRGHGAFMRAQYDEAIAYYRKEQELIQNSPARVREAFAAQDREALPLATLQIGRAYQKLGQADSARAAYGRALAADSSNATAHAWMAELLQELGEYDAALKHADEARRLRPSDPETAYLYGSLLAQTGQAEAAAEALGALVQRQPWHQGANYSLGRALQQAGKPAEAAFFLARADTLQKAGAHVEQLRTTAFLQPQQPGHWVKLAGAYLDMGRLPEANDALQTALYLRPQDLRVQNDLANIALARGDTSAAFLRYLNILRQDSTFTDGWVNLGVLYAMSDRPADARLAWERALRYRPQDPTVRAYLARLPGR